MITVGEFDSLPADAIYFRHDDVRIRDLQYMVIHAVKEQGWTFHSSQVGTSLFEHLVELHNSFSREHVIAPFGDVRLLNLVADLASARLNNCE